MNSEKNGIEYKNICVADLKSIITIYRKASEKEVQANCAPQNGMPVLATSFGWPLSLASCEGQILGYSYAVLNTRGIIEINSYLVKEFDVLQTRLSLTEMATKVFSSSFEGSVVSEPAAIAKFKHATQRLVDWLNTCN